MIIDQKFERTLARIANNVTLKPDPRDNKFDTFGIIIDCSDSVLSENKQGYITKMKIIDHTFNFKEYIDNKHITSQSAVQVVIKSQDQDDAPKVQYLGSVLRLRKFIFGINTKGEMYGFQEGFSNWIVVNTYPESKQKTIACINNKKWNNDRQICPWESEQIDKLMDFSRTFFRDNSLRRILWWNPINEPNNESHAIKINQTQLKVDLILKATLVKKQQKELELRDERGNKYQMNFDSQLTVEQGTVIKLRNVTVKWALQCRVIELGHYSTCLYLPSYFFDYQMFNKNFYNEHKKETVPIRDCVRQEVHTFAKRKFFLEIYPGLEDFYFEPHLLGNRDFIAKPNFKRILCNQLTMVRKEYFHKIPCGLDSFGNIELSKKDQVTFQKFTIECMINSVSTSAKNEFFIKCRKCQEITPFSISKANKTECCQVPCKIIFSVVINVVDETMKQPLPIYIVPRSSRYNPFLLWNCLPPLDKIAEWENFLSQRHSDFESKLKCLTKNREPVKMVVEIKKTKKGLFFLELTDTLFLP